MFIYCIGQQHDLRFSSTFLALNLAVLSSYYGRENVGMRSLVW